MRNPSPGGSVKKGSPAPSLRINLHHLLRGEELEDIGRSHIIIENGCIAEIGQGWFSDADITGGVAVPLPVNAHVHLNDYRAPDHYIGYSIGNYVGHKGLKHALITLYKEPLVAKELEPLLAMYGLIIDYQEHHWLCNNFRKILSEYNTSYIGLSRPKSWDDRLEDICVDCGGLGISNPTRVPPWALGEIASLSRRYIVSAHISETPKMEKTGGLHYLLSAGVRLKQAVHGTFLEEWEIKLLAEHGISLVVNPRSNVWFTGRLPPIRQALENEVVVALGTDNAGCFHPDIWVEAEFLFNYFPDIDPKLVVEIATLNGYKSIGMEPYTIDEGKEAFLLIADLGIANERSGNIYASIIRRITWSNQIIVLKKNKIYAIRKTFLT